MWRLEHRGQFKLIANTDLRFPPADFIQLDEQGLLINLFNLTGVDSPLPHYLLELALDNQIFADFLIIFNEQLYLLFYAIWKATHPLANLNDYRNLGGHLLGLPAASHLLYYADCLLLTPGILALKKCLQRFLGPIPFLLTEYIGDWLELNDISQLGGNSSLNNTILGSRFFTHQECVNCQIGPIQSQEFLDISFLKELMRYFAESIKIKISLLFDDTQVRLGKITLGAGYLSVVRQTYILVA